MYAVGKPITINDKCADKYIQKDENNIHLQLKVTLLSPLEDDDLKTPQADKNNFSPQSNNESEESIEIMSSPTTTTANIEKFRKLQNMNTSLMADSNNTDICVLESFYGSNLPIVDTSDDFTILNTPERNPECLFDESEVLLIESEYNEKVNNTCTDSDIEVLMSDEIVDSDWSCGEPQVRYEENGENVEEETASARTSVSIKSQDTTDRTDISGDDQSNASLIGYEKLSRMQLINIIREQEIRIRLLETTVQRQSVAQQKLFDCVDLLRMEFDENMTLNFQKSHETIN